MFFSRNFIKEDSLVRLGAYWLFKESDHELQFGLRKVIIHPNYAESSKGDNIALIRLDGAVTAFTFVQPVTFPRPTDVFDKSSDCWITGWGMTGENGMFLLSVHFHILFFLAYKSYKAYKDL